MIEWVHVIGTPQARIRGRASALWLPNTFPRICLQAIGDRSGNEVIKEEAPSQSEHAISSGWLGS